MRQLNSRYSKCLLWLWGVGFLFQAACSFPAVTSTFQTMSSEIESPLETCQNIAGTYEFIGTTLPGMPTTFRGMSGEVVLDEYLRLDKRPKNRETVTEVEIIQDQTTIRVRFKDPAGLETVVLPERPEDQMGCSQGKIILLKIREGSGESVTGTSVIKNTYFKSAGGSLHITLEEVAYLRSLFFFWKAEEVDGARFAPRTFRTL